MAEEVTLGDVDLDVVKSRTVSGVVTLISRSFLLQIVSTAGFLALSIFLGRPEIGLFIVINDLVSILGYFSDVGLAASLVQKKDRVSLADLRTAFTIQQILVLILVITTLVVSPWLVNYYHISAAGLWLLYGLLAAFFLASLKTIPSVVLERQLHFQQLATVEVAETLVFYAIAVALAWQGQGVLSYAWAVVVRGVVGTAIIYWLSPWRIGLGWSSSSLKSLLGFGLPYQINVLIATVKDRFINIVLWKIIGADGIGILGWAQTWSQKPLRFIMDNVTRVTFPGFSRLQEHPQELKRGIERTLFFISSTTFPILVGMVITAPLLVQLIPRYSKWEVALVPLAWYCFGSAWASLSTPLTTVLNAIGKVKTNSYLMLMWTALTWLLMPLLARRFGYLGVAYAGGIIALSSVVPIIIVWRQTRFSLKDGFVSPTLAAGMMLAVGWWVSRAMVVSWGGLVAVGVISVVVYGAGLRLIAGQRLVSQIRQFWYEFRRKS